METMSTSVALYIKVENGIPIDHPAFPSNLLQAFGEIPSNWEPFIRFDTSERTPLGVYEVWDSEAPLYVKVNGIWTDSYARRPMTQEERLAKDNEISSVMAENLRIAKEFAIAKRAEVTHNDELPLWDAHIQALDTFVYSSLDQRLPEAPLHVRRDDAGVILNVSSSGSEPNVIG